METQLVQTNNAPTQRQVKRTKEFLESRQEELSDILRSLLKEQTRDTVSQNAISNLEAALPLVRDSLKTYRTCSEHLEATQAGISDLILKSTNRKISMQAEEDSCGLYEKFNDLLSSYTNLFAKKINEQVEQSHDEARRLQDLLRDMEMELDGWKSFHSFVANSLKHLISNKARVEMEIQIAKHVLHPIRCVPSQVWIQVFGQIIDIEFGEYMQMNSNVPLRSTPHILSHVCQLWRKIVMQESRLWRFVVTHASTTWSQSKYELFKEVISQNSQSISVVANLSQSLYWYYNQDGVYDRYGLLGMERHQNSIGLAVPEAYPTVFDLEGKPYQLYVDMLDDQPHIMQKMAQIAFINPHTLVLSARQPLQYSGILLIPSGFSGVESLVILNEAPLVLPTATLSSTFPTLTALKLVFGSFPSMFPLNGYLSPHLEELYLRDDNGTSLPSPTTTIHLPRLHTLGINYPAEGFLKQVKMKKLKTLIFYAYNGIPNAAPTVEGHAADAYRQIEHLRLEEWPEPRENDDSYCGATRAFSALAQNTSALHSATFDRCYVDGEALVHLVTLSKEKDAVEVLPALEEMALVQTEGITRDQCDELKQLLKELRIFR